jgi:hypothetical protein
MKNTPTENNKGIRNQTSESLTLSNYSEGKIQHVTVSTLKNCDLLTGDMLSVRP